MTDLMGATEYDNPFTRKIKEFELIKSQLGNQRGVPVEGTPLPRVRSAALGQPPAPPVLSPEEVTRRDMLVAQLTGGNREVDMPLTAEIDAEIDENLKAIRQKRGLKVESAPVPESNLNIQGQPYNTTIQHSRSLPDFTKLQAINFEKSVIIIDSIEFALSGSDLSYLQEYCLKLATKALTEKIAAALQAFGLTVALTESNGTKAQTVPEMPQSEATESISTKT